MRTASIHRATAETDVRIELNLDCFAPPQVQTGVGFLDHMLTLFAFHGRLTLTARCAGDTDVDFHHTVEDVGICLGRALKQALGEKAGIARYGNFLLPMDEALVLCALDLSGRAHLNFDVAIPAQKVGDFDTELVKEFFAALAREVGAALHFKLLAGENSHHIVEAAFKGLGRALKQAIAVDEALSGASASSKGTLS